MAAKRITREQVEDKLTLWQQRLDLLHWDIRLDFETEPEDAATLAEITCHPQFDRATIIFNPGWRDWKVDQAIGELEVSLDYLLAHELVHPLMRDLDQLAMSDLDGMIHPDAYRVFGEGYHRKREHLVDRLARCLLDGWGPA